VVEATQLRSGEERFTTDDLLALSDQVGAIWTSAADRDWSVPAGNLEWTCTTTADHAVDCVYAPAFFLASRRLDDYPSAGADLTLGPDADPARLVESLAIATRLLAAVVRDADRDVRAAIFRYPELLAGAPGDFVPRGAVELMLHAHDVCQGLQVAFEPPADSCYRLREHTRPWPMWANAWSGLGRSDDPWNDLLKATGRQRQAM
jgi:hypothetical protein